MKNKLLILLILAFSQKVVAENFFVKGLFVCAYSKEDISRLLESQYNRSLHLTYNHDYNVHQIFFEINDSTDITIQQIDDSVFYRKKSVYFCTKDGSYLTYDPKVRLMDNYPKYVESNVDEDVLYQVFYVEGTATITNSNESELYQFYNYAISKLDSLYIFNEITVCKPISFEDYWECTNP